MIGPAVAAAARRLVPPLLLLVLEIERVMVLLRRREFVLERVGPRWEAFRHPNDVGGRLGRNPSNRGEAFDGR